VRLNDYRNVGAFVQKATGAVKKESVAGTTTTAVSNNNKLSPL
jgi:hypothetical protein